MLKYTVHFYRELPLTLCMFSFFKLVNQNALHLFILRLNSSL